MYSCRQPVALPDLRSQQDLHTELYASGSPRFTALQKDFASFTQGLCELAKVQPPLSRHSKTSSVRSLVSPSHRHNVGKVFSPRFGVVEYGSTLARDAIYRAHHDTQITLMVSQPLEMSWRDPKGIIRPYFPHYALLRADAIVIIDFLDDNFPKPAAFDARSHERFKLFTRLGATYEVWTASDIRQEPRLTNIRRLLSVAQHEPTAAEVAAALTIVRREQEGVRLIDLATQMGLSRGQAARVMAMIFCGHLRAVDPDGRLTEASRLMEADA